MLYPPLVSVAECDLLKERIAQAARGEAFVLLDGGGPQSAGAATADAVRDRLKTLLQAATVLTYASSRPVVKIGRFEFGSAPPQPDPQQIDRVYHSCCATQNLLRALTAGGYANLRQVHAWNRDFAASSTSRKQHQALVGEIGRALSFMHACGRNPRDLSAAEFFSAREGLSLEYECALTQVDPPTGRAYATSAHFLWIDGRDGDLDGAHPGFLSGIGNPVGVRLGGDVSVDDLLTCLDKLAPVREPGRLTLVVRMGPQELRDKLPLLVEKVTAEGHCVAWVCDPERDDPDGRLHPDRALAEVEGFFDVHRELGTHPGGIRVESTHSPWSLDLAFNLAERLRAANRRQLLTHVKP